ncbi:zinc-regulated transporter 2 [Plectosphaerella plurivora]|uniref:Zinc-regulated transporter 2 n=1 Tax=Plectosphaerella plurivora TaxID=936078 RepID=A0A9P8VDW6_9PEZI|nr:zinc-regulated transporter 2 [Plectosphaerella plurivora]
MDALPEAKPQCGGGKESGAYDLPLHVAALFIVLIASAMGCGFPVVAKKVKWLKVPPKVFFACKHFGTGVLVATAFVHLLPTAFASLTDPCLPDLFTDRYPAMPGVIMMAAMFMLFCVEMWLHGKTGGHSHGGPTGDVTAPRAVRQARQSMHAAVRRSMAPPRPPRNLDRDSYEVDDDDTIAYEKNVAKQMWEEKERYPYVNNPFDDPNNVVLPASEMPSWFIVFYEQYVRQRLELMNMIKASEARYSKLGSGPMVDTKEIAPAPPALEPFLDAEGQTVDPMVYRKMNLNITLLEGGILFHSIFVGITISLTIDGFIILLVAIVFHQMFEGLGLGSRIAEVPYPKGSIRPWVLVMAFGTTAPIGQAIGLMARGSYDPNSAFGLIIVGVFNAFSSGLLLWAALVDLLAEDFLSEEADHVMTGKLKIKAFCWVLLGAAGMSIVGAFA